MSNLTKFILIIGGYLFAQDSLHTTSNESIKLSFQTGIMWGGDTRLTSIPADDDPLKDLDSDNSTGNHLLFDFFVEIKNGHSLGIISQNYWSTAEQIQFSSNSTLLKAKIEQSLRFIGPVYKKIYGNRDSKFRFFIEAGLGNVTIDYELKKTYPSGISTASFNHKSLAMYYGGGFHIKLHKYVGIDSKVQYIHANTIDRNYEYTTPTSSHSDVIREEYSMSMLGYSLGLRAYF